MEGILCKRLIKGNKYQITIQRFHQLEGLFASNQARQTLISTATSDRSKRTYCLSSIRCDEAGQIRSKINHSASWCYATTPKINKIVSMITRNKTKNLYAARRQNATPNYRFHQNQERAEVQKRENLHGSECCTAVGALHRYKFDSRPILGPHHFRTTGMTICTKFQWVSWCILKPWPSES